MQPVGLRRMNRSHVHWGQEKQTLDVSRRLQYLSYLFTLTPELLYESSIQGLGSKTKRAIIPSPDVHLGLARRPFQSPTQSNPPMGWVLGSDLGPTNGLWALGESPLMGEGPTMGSKAVRTPLFLANIPIMHLFS